MPGRDEGEGRLGAILVFMVAILFFTFLDTSAKLASATLPALQIVWARFMGHLVIATFAYGMVRRPKRIPHMNAPGLQLLRSGFLLCATSCNFVAIRYLQLAETVSIFFSVPLLVTALAIPFLGERVGIRRWAAIAVGFIGVLIIIRPGVGIAHWAVFFSIAAALFTACYQLATRRLAALDDPATTQLVTPYVGALVLMPLMPAVWVMPGTAFEWLILGAAGTFGAIGHYLFIIAHLKAPAGVLAPFMYIQILYVTVAGYLVFGDIPDSWVFLGASLVMASGVYIWHRERTLMRERRGS